MLASQRAVPTNVPELSSSEAHSYLSTDELDAISRLASGAAGPAALRLAELAADLLENRLGAREHLLISDVLLRLVCKAQEELRQAVSNRLARNAIAPRNLIVFLANDEIAVARPVLLGSQVLTEFDLVQIVRHRSVLHGRSIALRATLSEEVIDGLVARGDSASMAFLLQNSGAHISLAAALAVANASKSASNLQPLLLRRLSPEMARDLLDHVSGELRREIRNTFKAKPDEVDISRKNESEVPKREEPRLGYVSDGWTIR